MTGWTAEGNPYQLILVGYKFGGAVAALAAVDFEARGWNPQVTTFGQPKVGNGAFMDYLTGVCFPWLCFLSYLSSDGGILEIHAINLSPGDTHI